MRTFILFFIFIFITGCTKYSTIGIDNDNIFFANIYDIKIDSPIIVDWNLALQSDLPLSKGIIISFFLPQFDNANFQALQEKHFVDAWIIKVSQEINGYSKTLGYHLIPFYSIAGNNERVLSWPYRSSVSIYYNAAAMQNLFDLFSCPENGHNKSIQKVSLGESANKRNKVFFTSLEEEQITPSINSFFPAGDSLLGKYKLSIAFFDRQSKKRKSSYMDFFETVSIEEEVDARLQGCPVPQGQSPKRLDPWKLFKF